MTTEAPAYLNASEAAALLRVREARAADRAGELDEGVVGCVVADQGGRLATHTQESVLDDLGCTIDSQRGRGGGE